MNILYRRDGSKNKIDNLDKLIFKRQKQLAKEEPKKKLKESITKIVSSKKKSL